MYSLKGYGEMIADSLRIDAHIQALRQTVKPGSVVLEIGTGPGVLAILACQLGASRVFAIEEGEVIQIARENAVANNCAERIEFIEGLSTSVKIGARADLIFSDLRGVLPLYGNHIPSIIDARNRFLAPGGKLCPLRDTLWAAVVEMPKFYSEIVEPWERNGLGQNLAAARRRVVDTIVKVHATADSLLTEPQLLATLDYSTIEDPDVRGGLRLRALRDGTGHGIVVWFDTDLADGVSFSNSPLSPATIYGSMFLPWTHPVSIERGDTVCAELEAKLLEEDYVWRWTTQVRSAGPSGEVRDQFSQSSLTGSVLSLPRLRKIASDYVPQLSDDGLLDRKILEMMDGHTTLEEIAKRLTADYPNRFKRWQDALTSASALSRKYSR